MLGVSPDSVASHVRFRAKYDLPFTLLSDPDHVAAEAFGVWGERTYMGKTYMGVNRSTFVIDRDGTVVKALYGVKADARLEPLLELLED